MTAPECPEWFVKLTHHATGPTWGVRDEQGNWVAIVHPRNADEAGRKSALERATLFCAAPQLLEACEALAQEPFAEKRTSPALDMARAAIAKAKP